MINNNFEYITLRQALEYIAKRIEPTSENIEKERVKQDVFSDEYAPSREKLKILMLNNYITVQGVRLKDLRCEYLKKIVIDTVKNYEENPKFRYAINEIRSSGRNFTVNHLNYNDIKHLISEAHPYYDEERLFFFRKVNTEDDTLSQENSTYTAIDEIYEKIRKQKLSFFNNQSLQKLGYEFEWALNCLIEQAQDFIYENDMFTNVLINDSRFSEIDWQKNIIYKIEDASLSAYILVKINFNNLKKVLKLSKNEAEKELIKKQIIEKALENFRDPIPASTAAKKICAEKDYGYSHDAIEDWLYKYNAKHFYRMKGKRGRPSKNPNKSAKIFDSPQKTEKNKNRSYKTVNIQN